MDGLTGLLEYTGDVGGASVGEEMATDDGLLFRQANAWVVEGGTCEVFQFSVPFAAIGEQISEREEPSVKHADAGDTSSLDKVHKVPVTEV